MSNNLIISTDLDKKMTKKDLYVDVKKADKLIENIINQSNIIEKGLNKIVNVLNKMVYKKSVKNEDRTKVIAITKKYNNQVQRIKKTIDTISTKYNVDRSDFAIKLLNDRISFLEQKIEELRKMKQRSDCYG